MRYILSVIYQFLEENYFSSSLDGHYEYLDFSGTNTTLLILVGGLCIGILVASVMMYYQSNFVGGFVKRLLSDKIFSAKEAKTLAELEMEGNKTIQREMCSRSSVVRKLVSYEEDGVIYDYKSELSSRLGQTTEEGSEDAPSNEANASASVVQNETPDASPASEKEVTPVVKEKKSASLFLRSLFSKGKALSVRVPDFTKARFFIPEELSYRADLRYGKKRVSVRALLLTFVCVILFFFLALRFIPVFVSMLDVSIGNVIS